MRRALMLAAAGTTIAAGMLSVTATANAATLPRPHSAPTSLAVHVSLANARTHGRDTVTGTLTSGRKALAGEVVALDVVNGRRLTPAGTAVTNRNGSVSFVVTPRGTTTYELVFAGTRTLAASHSGVVTVRVGR